MPVPTPTQEEIDAEIDALRKIKPTVRRRSIFGDDHHDAIDAQIDVLRFTLYDEAAIYKEWGEADEEGEVPAQNVLDAALDALAWKNGEDRPDAEGPRLVDGWKELVVTPARIIE